jgi:hypothetical protein
MHYLTGVGIYVRLFFNGSGFIDIKLRDNDYQLEIENDTSLLKAGRLTAVLTGSKDAKKSEIQY